MDLVWTRPIGSTTHVEKERSVLAEEELGCVWAEQTYTGKAR